ncbi:helix-turn-helix transcriptional regulator [Ramlibacter sp. G-1-2-2]|uniref:Helix-turn-helix transcriptional regulator n=1 Tax=Ramlibacter agri TaxID=2728837 RepID=A0A848H6R5_9BURK|nr:substrate-binding domain-containing protein [Ramlibacter agri]NML44253.1 helix-turn-helix transcriptional regulator [Ramlibacter agri]
MHEVTIKPEWIIRQAGGESLPRRLVELLVKVHELGSLAAACKATGVSYRYAWELLRQGETLFGEALIVMERGKGSKLTMLGEKLVWAEKRIVARLAPLLASLASELSAEIEKARSPSPGLLRIHASHGFSIQLLHDFLAAASVANELKYLSSLEAVVSLHNGECDVAGFHVPVGEFEADVLQHYGRWLNARSLKVISIVTRRQGFMVARGNPKEIYRAGDLARPGVNFINRQPGSGTRLLLELLLRKDGVAPASIKGYERCEYTHAAVAAFVASGMADVGYGVETPARQFKLDFIPSQTERYCLICHEKTLAAPALQQVLAVLRSTKYKTAVNQLPGYKVQKAGVVTDLRDAFGYSSTTRGK